MAKTSTWAATFECAWEAPRVSAPTLVAELHDVQVQRGGRRLFDAVSLRVCAGERVGLLGKNGVGKSTLLQTLAGMIVPSTGTATVLGKATGTWAARAVTAYMPEALPLTDELTVIEQLHLAASVRMLGGNARDLVDEQVQRLQLSAVAQRQCGALSKGTKQRVALAMALLHKPMLLLLDEPTSGVDDEHRAAVSSVLQEESARGAAMLLSTHVHDDVAAMLTSAVTLRSDGLHVGVL
jgi:ABC-type multidrug transport system ATPase subunit